MTRRLLLGAALAGLLALVGLLPPVTADTPAPDARGWVQLFNGTDLTGWKLPDNPNPGTFSEVTKKEQDGKVIGYDGTLKKDGKVVPLWHVEDGLLIGSGPSSHLFSERGDYENFIFRVEAAINDHGNSGQYFRTQFGPGFPRGYEAQINSTHGDTIRTGSLYPAFDNKLPAELRKSIVILDQLHKPDEWFSQEVIAEGNRIIINVNGRNTVYFIDEKNTFPKGHFALQGHDPGTVVKFRKIEVKELPSSSAKP
jgi:hypothetical protein